MTLFANLLALQISIDGLTNVLPDTVNTQLCVNKLCYFLGKPTVQSFNIAFGEGELYRNVK